MYNVLYFCILDVSRCHLDTYVCTQYQKNALINTILDMYLIGVLQTQYFITLKKLWQEFYNFRLIPSCSFVPIFDY